MYSNTNSSKSSVDKRSKKKKTNLNEPTPSTKTLYSSGYLTPEFVADEIVGQMTNLNNKFGTSSEDPVDNYFEVNNLNSTEPLNSNLYTYVPSFTIGPPPQNVDKAREDRINSTMDKIAHYLISQGQLNPAKSYTINTPRMRAHVGRMIDRIRERQETEFPKKKVTRDFSQKFHINTKNSKIVQVRNEATNKLNSILKHAGSTNKSRTTPSPSITHVDAGRINSTYTSLGSSHTLLKKKLSSLDSVAITSKGQKIVGNSNTKVGFSLNSTSSRFPYNGIKSTSKPQVKKPSRSNSKASGQSFKNGSYEQQSQPGPSTSRSAVKQEPFSEVDVHSLDKLKKIPDQYFRPKRVKEDPTQVAYRAKVDLAGFKDEHISLDLNGRRLIVEAFRPANGENVHPRRVIEVIDLPPGIPYENLEIARRDDGSLWIEEVIYNEYDWKDFEYYKRTK